MNYGGQIQMFIIIMTNTASYVADFTFVNYIWIILASIQTKIVMLNLQQFSQKYLAIFRCPDDINNFKIKWAVTVV